MEKERFKNSDEIISRNMLADMLKCHRDTISRWVEEEGLPAILVAKKYFFRWPEVKIWLDKKTLNKPKK